MVFCYQNCSDRIVRRNCSSDCATLLKLEAEGQEFEKFLRPLEQFIQTEEFLVFNSCNRMLF